MMPGLYNGKHGLWLNGKTGTADKFGAQEPMCVKGVLGANETVIAKEQSESRGARYRCRCHG